MIKVLVSLVLLFSSLLTTGCAAIFNGTSEQVAIRSNIPGTDIFVNEALVGRGSAITSFKKKQRYTITARKEGCQPTTVPVAKSFDPTTLLGVLIDFGIITVLIIDGVGTGAWQSFDQTSYIVDPVC